MLKQMTSTFLCLVVLSACTPQTKQVTQQSKSSTSTTTETTEQFNKALEEKYRTALLEARDKQQHYINAKPNESKGGVQSVHRAIFDKGIALIKEFPNDEKLINSLVKKLVAEEDKLIEEKRRKYYAEIVQERDRQQAYIDTLSEDKKGSVQTAQSAAFAKATALTYQFPDDVNLINSILKELFNGTKDAVYVTDEDDFEMDRVMALYEQYTQYKYIKCTPATAGYYHNQNMPEEALQHVYFNDKQIAFKWYDMRIGKGVDYQLKGCYANENQKDFILFVDKDGKRFVFQSTGKVVDNKVYIALSVNDILNQYVR